MRNSKKKLSSFSLRLKESRSGIYTQHQLAEKSGVSLKTIQRLENIEKMDNPTAEPKPLASNLLMLSQALDVTPEYLLFGDENMNIYMRKLEDELKNLSIEEIRYYHKQELTDKVLCHLKLTDSFVTNIQKYWRTHTLSCYRPYVQDTIIRYCHNRPKIRTNSSSKSTSVHNN